MASTCIEKVAVKAGEGAVSLRSLRVNQKARIKAVKAYGEVGRRMRDLGLMPGVEFFVAGRAPLVDPVALQLKNSVITLRNSEADYVFVEILEN